MMSMMMFFPVIIVGMFILMAFGLAFVGMLKGGRQQQRLLAPEDLLRERYARGEIGRQAYLDALSDILKDRYIRGELSVDEYEERVEVLLESRPLPPGSSRSSDH